MTVGTDMQDAIDNLVRVAVRLKNEKDAANAKPKETAKPDWKVGDLFVVEGYPDGGTGYGDWLGMTCRVTGFTSSDIQSVCVAAGPKAAWQVGGEKAIL